MSFYNNSCAKKISAHTNETADSKIADKGSVKNKVVLPKTCFFEGILRSLPQSTFASQLFNEGQTVDFYCNYSGFIEELRLSILATVANNNVSVNGNYLINRVEIYDTAGSVAQTIYADSIYMEFCTQNNDESVFEQTNSLVSTTYNIAGPYIPTTNLEILLRIPCAISDSQLKGKSVSQYLIRVYFSNKGLQGNVADLLCTDLSLLQYSEALSAKGEQMEVNRKRNELNMYRVLTPTRIALEIVQMLPNNFYDIRLTSWTQLSAYILFVVRSSPVSVTNVTDFIPILKYELYNENSQIVGTTITNKKNIGRKLGPRC